MNIVILSDIHGNYIALEAVLRDMQQQMIDHIICLGDVAATGAQPHECVQRLGELDAAFVVGNTDAWLLDPQPFEEGASANFDDAFMRKVHETDLWCVEQLTHADLDLMRTFESTIPLAMDESFHALFYHGSPRSFHEQIVATTPNAKLEPMFAEHYADLLCGGHTHQPFVRRVHQSMLMNPGSVGLPYERIRGTDETRNPPWAEYAIVRYEAGRLAVDLRRVPIDVEKVVRAIRESGMPHAETWSADWR